MTAPAAYLDLDRVSDFSFLRGSTIALGAVFEPCIHPQINRLIDILNRNECKILLVTNGHNLHRKTIPALFDSDLEMVTFSFDGLTERTYEHIRVGGNYLRTLDNIEKFRSAFSDAKTLFAINFTIMRYNLDEVSSAPAFWEERDFHIIRYIAMVVREDDEFLRDNSLWDVRHDYFHALDQAAEYVVDNRARISLTSPYFQSQQSLARWGGRIQGGVLSSDHPGVRMPRDKDHPREFQYGPDFGMHFPCKSPFVSARVLWDGTVMLCHNQVIGNLYERSFEEVWNGKLATQLREKVKNSDALCSQCDYFRLCINSHFIDLDKQENYYSQTMLDKHQPRILFS